MRGVVVPRRPSELASSSIQVLVVIGALGLAALSGLLLVYDVTLGIALIGAMVFVPMAFLSPPLALSVWMASAFLTALPGVGMGSNRALYLLFIVWVGTLFARDGAMRDRARRQIPMLGGLVLFIAWALCTLLWAPMAGEAHQVAVNLVISAGVFLLVATFVLEPRHACWLLGAYVLGTVLSVLAGAATGGLSPSAADLDTATSVEGRLQGGVSDPNYLAAACVPAIMLAGGLMAQRRDALFRLALITAIGILAIGLIATESRGGLLAALIVSILALFYWRGRRLLVASLILVVVCAGLAWLSASPSTWERITSDQDGGSGRTDIWLVAWRVVEAHPIDGVGLAQFPAVSQDFIREPGALSRADLIVDQKIQVHNSYLQLWAEAGAIGLIFFMLLAGRSIAGSHRAAKLFERRSEPELATLSRACLLALVGALTASFFLSNLDDRRIWVLLALGPVLLSIARSEEAAR